MPSARDWVALARGHNAAMAALGVLAGAWWAHAQDPVPVAWAVLAAICLTATANSWNDAADVEIDRLAHPERPIPRGVITVSVARRFGMATALLALFFSWLTRAALVPVTVAVTIVLALYSPRIKKHGALGNIVVAIVASLPFLYGAWAADSPGSGVFLMALAAPLHLGREVAKDLEDAEGDAGSRSTIPLSAGVRIARLLVLVAVMLFVAVLGLPIKRRPLFAVAVLPSIFLAALGAAAAIKGRRGSPRLLKAAMVCALVAALVVRV